MSTRDSTIAAELGAIVRGAANEAAIAAARAAYQGALPEGAPAASPREHARAVYRAMQTAAAVMPHGAELAARPALLDAHLDWAAVVDPSLFLASMLHHGMSLGSILSLGDREAVRPHVEALGSLSAVGVYTVTELGHANSHLALGTEARFDPRTGEFVLTTPSGGARKVMGNAAAVGVPKLGVVYATLVAGGERRGVFGFVVPLTDGTRPAPGVRIVDIDTPLLPLDYTLLAFDGARVPLSSWLSDGATMSPEGAFTDVAASPDDRTVRAFRVLVTSWTSFVGGLAAVTRASAAIALRFSRQRVTRAKLTEGRVTLDTASQRRQLFGALASAYALTSLANHLRAVRARGGPPPPTGAGATASTPWVTVNRAYSVGKAIAGSIAASATARCRLGCGALGALSINKIIRYEGLAQACQSAGGDNALVLLDAGRSLADSPFEAPPVTTPVTTDLRDPEALLALVRAREALARSALSAEVRDARARGEDEFSIWDARHAAARDLGTCHGTTAVVEAMMEHLDRGLSPASRALFGRITALFALEQIRGDLGGYAASGLLAPPDLRRIDALADALCAEIAPNLDDLLEAFGTSPDDLGAPIGKPGYADMLSPTEPR